MGCSKQVELKVQKLQGERKLGVLEQLQGALYGFHLFKEGDFKR